MGSESLGDMVVNYRAELTSLVQGSQRAQQEIRQVGTSASETSSKMEGGLGSAISSVGGTLFAFISVVDMAVGVIRGLADAAVNVGQAIIDASAPMEQASVTMETLMGSTGAAQEMMKQLWDFAANTPFEFAGVEQAGAKLKAVGFSAQEIIPDLTAIGDALSALGQASDADLNSVAVVFGQIKNTGHLMAQDMMQLTDRGIPAWRMLAEQMHLTIPEVQALTTKGLIPADQAISMLVKGMEQAFGGGMQKQSKTFTGLMSTLHDNIQAAWRAMTGPAFIAAKKGLEDLGNLVSSKSFQAFADMAGKMLAPAFQLIGQDIDHIVTGMQSWMDQKGSLGEFQGIMRGVGDTIYDVWRGIKEFISWIPLATQNYFYFADMMDLGRHNSDMARGSIVSLGSAIGWMVEGIAGAIGILVGFINTIEELMRKAAEGINQFIAVSNVVLGTNFSPIDMSLFTPVSVGSFSENTRSSSGNFGGSNFGGSSGTGGTGGTGGSGGGGGGGGGRKKPPKKKPPLPGATGDVAPPGSESSSSGIGTGGTGGSGNNILIVIEIDGQVFASQVVKQVYDQVRLRLGPGGIQAA